MNNYLYRRVFIEMLNLQKRIKGVDENKQYLGTRISIRDKLLSQGLFLIYLVFLLNKMLEHFATIYYNLNLNN